MSAELTAQMVNAHIGARIRLRRRLIGVSQIQLADALGVTFQQIQKYERASNRVSASTLYTIARRLGTSVGWYYEGLPGERDAVEADAEFSDMVRAFVNTTEGLEMARYFAAVPKSTRQQIVRLVQAIADVQAGIADPEEDDARLERTRLGLFGVADLMGLGHLDGAGGPLDDDEDDDEDG